VTEMWQRSRALISSDNKTNSGISFAIGVIKRGSLSLVSATEELLERKSSDSGLENRDYGRRDLSR
jgi:hypothetical protein